jgi:Protein of unknown function (DUF2917)
MKIKTIWNERFGMLMASGSPGSALAYQLGSSAPEPPMMRRNIATAGYPDPTETAEAPARRFGARLQRAVDGFGAWTDVKERSMDPRATPNLVHLGGSGRRSLRLEVAKGFRVIARSGEVWVTQAGFIEDHVLRPGDALTLDSPHPAVVTSFGAADIEVIAPPAARGFEPTPVISLAAIERAQREAHRLRAEYMREMFSTAAGWIWRLGRRLVPARQRA